MERRDLIAKNVPIMAEHGRALAKCAREGVRVLVVANPACTNCLVVSQGVGRWGGNYLNENDLVHASDNENRSVYRV